MGSAINGFYEFSGYRLDPVRRLLTKDGRVVALKPKIFDTLLVLVSSAGSLVEKEALMQEVWGEVAVEEGGLTKNISILRKTLGESPDEHQFIVTVPGRGYRFVASVTTVSSDAEPAGEREGEPVRIETQTVSMTITPPPVEPGRDRKTTTPGRHSRALRAGIATAALLVAAAGIAFYLRSRPALSEGDTILLADFVNRTGDAAFDETLQQGLAVQLEQSPRIHLCADTVVRQTLQLMGRSPDERLTASVAREICQRRGLKAFITGFIAPLGSHYVITLEAIHSQDGSPLARGQMEAESKEQVLRTLSTAASSLRRNLGESLASIQKYDALLERTTSSLPALQAYSMGFRATSRGKTRDAQAWYRKAIDADPDFAYAYAGMAVLYRNSRKWAKAEEYAAKAYALRDGVSQREKLYLTSLYHELVTGDIGKNIEALQLFEQIYPSDGLPHNNLGVAYINTGQFDRALEEGRISLRLSPNASAAYGAMGNILIRTDRFKEARGVYREGLARGLDSLSIHRGLYRIAFVDRDSAAMEQHLSWAIGHSNEDAALDWQARAAAYSGQWQRSGEYARRAMATAAGDEQPELAAEYEAESALRGAALGQCEGITSAIAPVKAVPNPVSLTRLALALAVCGQTEEARPLLEELSRRYRQHTVVNWIWIPAIRAATELAHGNGRAAVELLAPASRYEGAAEFWPQYMRGQAYLSLGMGSEAASEFLKILDHRGQDTQSALYPLARLGWTRSMALKADTARARKGYADFLDLWKDADPGLPALVKAKEEREKRR
jgi:DNA-binding winged helix-turn-helix (wHTH) protein/tetratricopeptide (TPR) repeat protein